MPAAIKCHVFYKMGKVGFSSSWREPAWTARRSSARFSGLCAGCSSASRWAVRHPVRWGRSKQLGGGLSERKAGKRQSTPRKFLIASRHGYKINVRVRFLVYDLKDRKKERGWRRKQAPSRSDSGKISEKGLAATPVSLWQESGAACACIFHPCPLPGILLILCMHFTHLVKLFEEGVDLVDAMSRALRQCVACGSCS